MLLALFYAEELKRDILDMIQSTDRMMKSLKPGSQERVPKGTKNPVDKALAILVADRAITADEKKEIVELIDYRNRIGHELHALMGDLSTYRPIRWPLSGRSPYRYDAVRRLQHFHKHFNGLYRTHHYVRTYSFNGLLFRSAERTFLADLKRLNAKVVRLLARRSAEVKALNAEMSLKDTGLEGDWHPDGPWSRYDNGRLTEIGVEICYRLFDMGRSPMAVACLMGISLIAARKRQKAWRAVGGKRRKKIDLKNIARPNLRRRYDD